MPKSLLSSWPKTYQEAVAVQEELRYRVLLTPLPRPPRLVAGADAITDRADRRIFGAMAVYSYPELELVEEAGAAGECPFPYRTGLLSFREIPILAAALGRLQTRPEVILVDGQGIAHPRGLGLASHLGWCWTCPPSARPRAAWWARGRAEAGGRIKQSLDLAGKNGGFDPADPKGRTTPLPFPRASDHPGGEPGHYPGLRYEVPDSSAFASGGSANPAPEDGGAAGRN